MKHGSSSGVSGILQADFDTVTNAYTTSQQSAAPAPAIQVANAGSTGRFLRLIYDGVNNNINSISFNQTAPGLWETITAEFDFRIFNALNNPADGFAFMLIPTSIYGNSGVGAQQGATPFEEPNFPGVFGIGFDVYPRSTQNDVSAHWSGAEYQNVTMANADINLTSGNFHHAKISLVHVPGGARVTVTLTPNINLTPGTPYTPINNLFIPGLNAYTNRVQFAGRTGGLNMNVDLDNIVVHFGFPTGMVPAEEYNISRSLNTLVPGQNMLAIQGLNRAASDGDFLIIPEMVGRSVQVLTNTQHFYSQPTPGSANEGGAAGLAGDPIFSIPGGVYTNATISLALSTLTPNATIRYTIDGTTPSASSLLYTAAVNIANSTVVKARVFSPGLLPGRIVTQTYTMLGPDVLTFNSNLPLVIISTFGQGIAADIRTPSSMVFIDTYRGRASLRDTPDAQVRGGIELRGSSSLGFPKNSMGFETQDENTNDFAVSLLGMPAESDWVLYAPYTDKTFMNDYLAYELWDAMGRYSVRRRFVEVFRDTSGGRLTLGDYWGIYVLIEKIKIDNDRVDIPQLSGGDNAPPNVTGGYVFKRDRFDGNEFTFNVPGGTGFGGSALAVEDPKGNQITTAQKNYLISWFAQVSAAL